MLGDLFWSGLPLTRTSGETRELWLERLELNGRHLAPRRVRTTLRTSSRQGSPVRVGLVVVVVVMVVEEGGV